MVIFAVHPESYARAQESALKHSTVAVIPARYSSTRLPGKPLADIAGHPMIEHVYRRTAAAPSIDAVVVATDDERIRVVVEGFGGVAHLTSTTHQSGTDRLAEVVDNLRCSLVVNVQVDEPLIEPTMIEQVLEPFHENSEIMMTTLRCPISDPADLSNPHIVKVVTDVNGYALYFSRGPIPFSRNNLGTNSIENLYKHIGLYAYRRDFLLTFTRLARTPLEQMEALEQLRALEHGFRIKTIETKHAPIGIDTPEDLERVRRIAGTTINV